MMTNTSSPHSQYMPYLDGVRTIAIAGVLISHFAYNKYWIISNPKWGELGVDLFFVLSGFLITQILLRYRDEISDKGGRAKYFRTFYSRRILRIFPIYYLTIGIAALLGYEPVRNYLIWFLTYTSNIALTLYNRPPFGAVNHFWSLAIEEQFYLFWPIIVFLVPKQKLHRTILAIIAIGPISRMLPIFFGWTGTDAGLHTRLDLLGMGALLAFYWRNPSMYKQAKTLLRMGASMSLPLVIFSLTDSLQPGIVNNITTTALLETAIAFIAVVFIDIVAQPKPPRIFSILGWKPIQYIGKISYGIYVYHLFVRLLMPNILQMFNLTPPSMGLVEVLLYGFVSILVASISWYVIERPINRLKDRLFSDRDITTTPQTILCQTADDKA